MATSVKLGTVLGIPVRLHVSWFIIFFFVTFLFEAHFGRQHPWWSGEERWLVSVATSLLLFVSVLAHELSHSLVAIRRNIPVIGITLMIFGGVSQIAREASRPSTEFIVAVVGPLSSIILAFVFLGLFFGVEAYSEHLSAIFLVLFSANLGLGIFNMLPGFPLDGGRVLRAVVWHITRNYWRATRLATLGGQAVAATMIAAGVVLVVLDRSNVVDGLWLVILGIFLQTVASASQRQSRVREKLSGYSVRGVMTSVWPVAPGHVTLHQIMDDYLMPSGSDFVVISPSSAPAGVITRRAIGRVPRGKWRQVRASEIMVPLDQVAAVGPGVAAYDALEIIEGKEDRVVPVVDNGVLLGFVSRDGLRHFTRDRSRT